MSRANRPFFPDGLPAKVSDLGAPAVPAAPAASPLPDAFALLRALKQHWFLGIVLGAVAAAASGLGAWKLLPGEKYVARNVLEVKASKPILLMETVQEKTDFKIFQSTQLALVGSRMVVQSALKRPGIANLPSVREQADPTDWLEGQIVAEFPSSPELMEISLRGAYPKDLAPLVNAVTDAYLEEIVEKDEHDRTASINNLQALHDQGEADLAARRAEMRKLAEAVGSDDRSTLAVRHNGILEQLAFYRTQLLSTHAERKQAEAELSVYLETADRDLRTPDPSDIARALAEDPELREIKARIAKLSGQLATNRRLVRRDDPSVRTVANNLEQAKQAYAARERQLRPQLGAQYRAREEQRDTARMTELNALVRKLAKYEEEIDTKIADLDAEARAFNNQTLDLNTMRDGILQKEETNHRIGKELEAHRIETKAPHRVRVIQRCESAKPAQPGKRLAAVALVALSSFGLALFGVSWREYRLGRVGSPRDLVEGLGLRLIGTLPAMPAADRPRPRPRRGLPDPNRWQSLLIESIDATRTLLLRDNRDNALRTIMITSASKGEGKSSLSGHLAISLARTGRRTLLADFDLRSPSVHLLFDLPPGPGTADILRGEVDLADAVRPVMADLDVLPAGRCDAESIRALGQDALPALLARASERYDFVVIDTTPVLPVADALLISGHVDAVILSVYREVSRVPAVRACRERLGSLGVRLLGVVVTGIPVESYGAEYSYAARPEAVA